MDLIKRIERDENGSHEILEVSSRCKLLATIYAMVKTASQQLKSQFL